jgi:hypothetical protein
MTKPQDIKRALDIEKPAYGSPCNGCGLCCRLEVCYIGKQAFGEEQAAPCPALMSDGKRYYCGFVIAEETSELRATPIIANALGIGKGCDADV